MKNELQNATTKKPLLWYSDYLRTVTAKDLSNMLGVSLSSANRYMVDIKKEYKAKRVFFGHIMDYFKLSDTAIRTYLKLLKNSQKHSKTLKNSQN